MNPTAIKTGLDIEMQQHHWHYVLVWFGLVWFKAFNRKQIMRT